MNYFNMEYDKVFHDMPYALVVFLSSSVPKYKGKKSKDDEEEEQSNDINDILMGQMKKKV